jgi:hypothetical protein
MSSSHQQPPTKQPRHPARTYQYNGQLSQTETSYPRPAPSADLLLHPVRLRIVQAFLGDRALTTSQLSAGLSDVPPASLYRHVARLVNADVLQVVAERRVRSAVERTYVLRLAATSISTDEIAKMSAEDHRQAFMAFVAGLLADADRYLQRPTIDPLRDGASYWMAGLWLDDAEFRDLLADLTRVLQPRAPTGRERAAAASWRPCRCPARKPLPNREEKGHERRGSRIQQ